VRALLLLVRWEEMGGSRGGGCAHGGSRRAQRDAGATGRPGAAVAGAWHPRGGGPLLWSVRWRVGEGAGVQASVEAGQAASAVGQKVERAAH
jgi:hypothetical protein